MTSLRTSPSGRPRSPWSEAGRAAPGRLPRSAPPAFAGQTPDPGNRTRGGCAISDKRQSRTCRAVIRMQPQIALRTRPLALSVTSDLFYSPVATEKRSGSSALDQPIWAFCHSGHRGQRLFRRGLPVIGFHCPEHLHSARFRRSGRKRTSIAEINAADSPRISEPHDGFDRG